MGPRKGGAEQAEPATIAYRANLLSALPYYCPVPTVARRRLGRDEGVGLEEGRACALGVAHTWSRCQHRDPNHEAQSQFLTPAAACACS